MTGEPRSSAAEATTREDDPLLRALRELPPRAPHGDDVAAARRAKATARAAFVRAFEDDPWHVRFFGSAGRAAVPVVLASVVGIYLTWAVAAANALFR